ncbi:uncharacterized protein TM35_001161070, partial [Trypanosoma theileri]
VGAWPGVGMPHNNVGLQPAIPGYNGGPGIPPVGKMPSVKSPPVVGVPLGPQQASHSASAGPQGLCGTPGVPGSCPVVGVPGSHAHPHTHPSPIPPPPNHGAAGRPAAPEPHGLAGSHGSHGMTLSTHLDGGAVSLPGVGV